MFLDQAISVARGQYLSVRLPWNASPRVIPSSMGYGVKMVDDRGQQAVVVERHEAGTTFMTQPDIEAPQERPSRPPAAPSTTMTRRALPAKVAAQNIKLDNAYPEHVMQSADEFNDRHRARVDRAKQMLDLLASPRRAEPAYLHAAQAIESAFDDVRRNRLFWTEMEAVVKQDGYVKKKKKKKRQRKHFDWPGKVWEMRKKGNSRAYYESETSRRKFFDSDWQRAIVPRLTVLLTRCENQLGNLDVAEKIAEVGEALFDSQQILMSAFDCYSVALESGIDRDGELGNLQGFGMGQNAFTMFFTDCQLLSNELDASALGSIWVACNAVIDSVKGTEAHEVHQRAGLNAAKYMNRLEFVEAQVRIAIEKYINVSHEKASTVADAVRLHLMHVENHLPLRAKHDSDDFRSRVCYTDQVANTLLEHVQSLRNLFSVYSRQNRDAGSKYQSTSLMSLGEWLQYVEHLRLIEDGHVSRVTAKLIFKCSRMRVADGLSEVSETKLRSLFFEDFLEANIHLARCMALPTDAEVKHAGASDAGEFLEALRVDAKVLHKFIGAFRHEWGSMEPRQATWRCVGHFMNFLLRLAQSNTSRTMHGPVDNLITEGEAEEFASRCVKANYEPPSDSAAGLFTVVSAAPDVLRAQLVDALQHSDLFSAVGSSDLDRLVSCMQWHSFNQGEYVYEEEDEIGVGSQVGLFVVVEGCAIEMQSDEDGFDQECRQLNVGDFFGANDLVSHLTRRSTTVRAQSALLRTVGIIEAEFDGIMGKLKHAVRAADARKEASTIAAAKEASEASLAAKALAEEAAKLAEQQAERARAVEELENE